ncbi:hypothetical protein [Methylobacter psychrophilus]|uniref:hypothetical protein n=1 Tax=Methylobacter psychrophilus TaxID=96941 RepID=UPI0021D4B60A|nr:hypothetical protein [Methylobacter psychrophilus]
MNKNTYLGLALATCLGVVSAPLLAELSSAPEYNEPIPTFNEHQEPSELQRQKAERNRPAITAPARISVEQQPAQTNEQIPTFNEHQEPSELQRQKAQ